MALSSIGVSPLSVPQLSTMDFLENTTRYNKIFLKFPKKFSLQ